MIVVTVMLVTACVTPASEAITDNPLYTVDGFTYGMTPRTTLSTVRSYFTGAVSAVNDKGVALKDTDFVGTGAKITLANGLALTMVLEGDSNGNGKLESNDAFVLRSICLGIASDRYAVGTPHRQACDLNRNGRIESNDYLMLRQALLGIRDSISRPRPANPQVPEEFPPVEISWDAGIVKEISADGTSPCLISLDDNSLLAAYRTADGIVTVRSTDDGSTWSEPKTASFFAGQTCDDVSLYCDSGTVYLAYRVSGNNGNVYASSLQVSVSYDRGNTWSSHSTVCESVSTDGTQTGVSDPCLGMLNGVLTCFYANAAESASQNVEYMSFNGGVWKQHTVLVDGEANGAREGNPVWTQLKSGTYVCLFESKSLTETDAPCVIQMIYSDNASTWSSPTTLCRAETSGCMAACPGIAEVTNGQIVISFLTDEDSAESGENHCIMKTMISDGSSPASLSEEHFFTAENVFGASDLTPTAETGIYYHNGTIYATFVAGNGVSLKKTSAREQTEAQGDTYSVYVDPVNGNDANSGKASAPVRTPGAAQMLARTYAAKGDKDVTVYLHGGVYTLTETWQFTEADTARNGHTVTYTAVDGETPVISGGYPVTGFTLHDSSKNIYVADVSDYTGGVENGLLSRDFYVNGNITVLARTAENLHGASFDTQSLTTDQSIFANLSRPQDAVLVIRNYWTESRVRVTDAVTTGNSTRFTMIQPAWGNYNATASLGGAPINADQFAFMENAYEFLNEPGEWYLNAETGKLYYIPRDGENLSTASAYLGALEQLITINGTDQKSVENLTFSGLTFSHTTWTQAETDEGLLVIQGNVYKSRTMTASTMFDNSKWITPVASVYGRMLNGVTFDHNTFRCLGNAAIHLDEGTKNCNITCNTFADLAGTGVMLGNYSIAHHDQFGKNADIDSVSYLLTENNRITDNRITNIGTGYSSACGIMVGYSRGTDVSYNTLTNLPYTAISLGWGWGFNQREMRGEYYSDGDGVFIFSGSTITNNYIDDIMNVLFDGGGIYTLGRNDNSTVRDNYIANIHNDYGGIYLDNGSQGFTVTNNAIVNAHRNYIYKGDYNYIKNNYAKKATVPDIDLREPLVSGQYHYTFTANYLSNAVAVQRIRAAAGER